MKNIIKNYYPPIIGIGIYFILLLISLDFVYFWDNIQYISKEGYWFYKTNFLSLLIPAHNEFGIFGVNTPAMGIMTAFLWKIFGYHLWVSHVFAFFWAVLFVYYSWKIVVFLFPEKWRSWVFFLVIIESTILTQFVTATPDIILLTAFVMAVRAILERKPVLLSIALVFLCTIHMRGALTGFLLFFANLYIDYQRNKNDKYTFRSFFRLLLPYLPVAGLLLSYYAYFFLNENSILEDSPWKEHYILPKSVNFLIYHMITFGMRLLENGRFIVYLLAIYLVFTTVKKQLKWSIEERFLAVCFVLIFGLYFLFVFVTQVPFNARHFMPMYFVLTLFVLHLLVKNWHTKSLKITFLVLYFFALTGHFWVYPEKITTQWESTLMHIPYYELREEVFDYIDKNEINYDEIMAWWNIAGDRGFVELKNKGKIIGGTETFNTRYFIYTNVSTMPDEIINNLKNKELWNKIRHFEKFPVVFTIYKKRDETKLYFQEGIGTHRPIFEK